ncbi:MAG: MFS transporter [Verrucomicrobiota bacterium]
MESKNSKIDEIPSSLDQNIPNPRSWSVGTLTYTLSGLMVLFFWLLWGDFAWCMKERAAVPVAQLLLKQLKASDMIVGLLVGSLPSAFGMIIGPMIGVMSDRHRGSWGRRIPFLLIPTPLIALSMSGLAFTPFFGKHLHEFLGASSPGLMPSTIIAFGFFWSLFEISTVISNSVFGGLINDVVPPSVIGKFFGVFRAVSLLAGIIFNYWMIGKAETHFMEIFLGLAVLYAGGITVMCFKVKEGDYPSVATSAESSKGKIVTSNQCYMTECYAHPYYLWLFIALAFGALAAGPVNTFSVFYAKSVGMTVDEYGKCVALTYAISLSLAYFLGMAADRFHPLRISIVVTVLYLLFMLWGGIFAVNKSTFTFAYISHSVLSGAYLTGAASLLQRLLPKEKFGQLASAAGIFNALSFTLLPPLVGFMLDFSGHIYRYTFLFSSLLSGLALISFLMVHHQFMKLGGHQNYSPPE